MKAVPIAIRKATAPVTQVPPRPPRQAPMKNLAQRCATIAKKKSCTDQKCRLFTKWPTLETCHHAGPHSPSTTPEASTTTNAAIVSTPKT